MSYEMRNGQGSAFPKTKTKDTQPDFQGEMLTPSGEKLEISMWRKPMKNGAEFFSISVKPPFVKDEPAAGKEVVVNGNDDLPFN